MNHQKYRTHDLNRSSKPIKHARTYPILSITLGLCLHASCPTPDTHKPALQAARSSLSETGKNAPVRHWPYDSTFALLRFATSSRTLLRAFQHPLLPLKHLFSGSIPLKRISTHNEFLSINLPATWSATPLSRCPSAPVPSLCPRFPLPILLLLESPLSRTPFFADNPRFLTAFRRMRSTLTPKVDLSEQGRLPCAILHYAGAALVDHVVLKGVKVETQADCTPLRSALAFVPVLPAFPYKGVNQ